MGDHPFFYGFLKMQFIDEAKIFIKSGDGGDGCLSFRREAHTPKGGPDGGDGGKGGNVVFQCIAGLNTLIDFRYTQHFKARKGEHGKGKQRHGANSDDVIINVPVGTQLFYEDGETLFADMTVPGQKLVAAKGGDGGYGNTRYKSSTNRAPRKFQPGFEGEEKWLWLKLKLLSDVGLVGLPNAGKSTFLNKVSNAKPKIADYPFTTMKPKLGVAGVDGKEFIIADLPGLIEGASEGRGLGHRFLKHVERCNTILHLIDISSDDIIADYKTIRAELEGYNSKLTDKEEIIVLNKTDILTEEEIKEKVQNLSNAISKEVMIMSGISGGGVQNVLRKLEKSINKPQDIAA